LEPISYGRAHHIVTPSRGLAEELLKNFSGATEDKIRVIANPVDLERMQPTADFDRQQMRGELGFSESDIVMVFVATGHFERKGLPMLIEAMQQVGSAELKLLIVGGREYMIDDYSERVVKAGLKDQVVFTGFKGDIRPYLWASDLFVFPSAYETFSMVSYEAAAAGLPVIASELYGVEEFLNDGYNGWLIERTANKLAEKLGYVLQNRSMLEEMGQNAIESVQRYSIKIFGERWRAYYKSIANGEILSNAQIQNIPSEVGNR
jgi:glycosyltransferase involved in cell wall biosynthesis